MTKHPDDPTKLHANARDVSMHPDILVRDGKEWYNSRFMFIDSPVIEQDGERYIPFTPEHPAYEAWERVDLTNGDYRCTENNGRDCWIIPGDKEYQCYGVTKCPNGLLADALYRWHICECCFGWGWLRGAGNETCPTCHGLGGQYEREK